MMKFKRWITWCREISRNPTKAVLWKPPIGNIRSLFSRSGKWDPQLSPETRLKIEEHWKPIIQQHDKLQSELTNSLQTADNEKCYVLSMFPYPSGNLHLGHVRVYTISDVMARYHRLQGKMVIHPMGWDAFGLPAENAAMERGIHPKEWTYSNIKRMKQQLEDLSLSFDWNREFATCDPSYYKWTQYLFLKMFEAGLAFQKKGLVNWDPVDKTVLANEQIDGSGCSWRSGAKVEKKYLTQWYLRDTVFSESLLQGLEEVDPELWRDIILVQRNWISEIKGHRIDLKLKYKSQDAKELPLSFYTEHLDLIYGVSHVCVKPTHHLCVEFDMKDIDAVLPIYAVHPLTGQHLKLVVAKEENMFMNRDVMLAIPCISDSDREAAERLNIPYVQVLDDTQNTLINSDELNGLRREQAIEIIRKKTLELGIGGEKISEQLNDWLISRQRYWGTPIPIIHCEKCGTVPVPYDQLPVKLPETDQLINKGGCSPLTEDKNWLEVPCPRCSSPAKRETDTMDTFVDSSWYFLRFIDPHNQQLPFSKEMARKYMPVDLYIGGKEHALLHLYFARFVCHFLHSLGLIEQREPFKNLLTQGMVKGESYKVKKTGKYIPADKVDFTGQCPLEKESGEELIVEFEKMSKSKYNGVNPEDVIAEYGVDSTRLCILSNVSPQSDRDWSNTVFKGVVNWQNRVWSLVTTIRNGNEAMHCSTAQEKLTEEQLQDWEDKIMETRNHILNHVNFHFETTFYINSAISRLHSYVSWLLKVPLPVAHKSKEYEQAVADLIIILAVMAPHFASELWAGLADVAKYKTHPWEKGVLLQRWPQIDDNFLMPLTYLVNHVAISDVGVPFKDFGNLNEEMALAIVKQDGHFSAQFSQYTIEKYSLSVRKFHKASLSLKIPDYHFQTEYDSKSQLKKQMLKLSKQKKKLYTIEQRSDSVRNDSKQT
ncbi:unnamed protein product [Lymnaea stagnalis]|uniref:leucine--tRNA ligase n=1 Tax=Lymnaea stagnalis TaxID=6523 RepID=A0AAV2IEX4_LYMST